MIPAPRRAQAANRIQHPEDVMAHSDRQAHMAFIQRNLDFLLAAAWQGYRLGMVVVERR